MKKLSLFAAVIGFAAVMVACCDKGAKGDFDALTAQEWKLDKIVYTDNTVEAPENVSINFTDTLFLSGRGACNRFFGKFEASAESDSINILPVGSTMMMCLNMEFETTYFNLLESVATYKANATALELADAEKTFTLVFSPKPEEVVEENVVVANDSLIVVEEIAEEETAVE